MWWNRLFRGKCSKHVWSFSLMLLIFIISLEKQNQRWVEVTCFSCDLVYSCWFHWLGRLEFKQGWNQQKSKDWTRKWLMSRLQVKIANNFFLKYAFVSVFKCRWKRNPPILMLHVLRNKARLNIKNCSRNVCMRERDLGSQHHACALHVYICEAGLPGALLVCFNPSISLLHFYNSQHNAHYSEHTLWM